MDLMEVAYCLVEKAKTDYNGDISLINIYGSYINNEAHQYSDLDLFFVPKTEKGYNLGKTFILNGIGYDFWALSWERLERIAKHEEGTIYSIITDGKIIYHNTEDDLIRYNKLIEIANQKNNILLNENILLQDIYSEYFKIIGENNLTEIRKSIIKIIYSVSELLSEINGKPIKRIRKHQKSEILKMDKIPDSFEIIYENLFVENDIKILKELVYKLIVNTIKLIKSVDLEKETFKNLFTGFYEEMIQHYNKIYYACDNGDIYTPLYASVELTNEIEKLFVLCNCNYKLPDMVKEYDSKDLNKIKSITKRHQLEFVELLKENNIQINEFNDIVELKEYIIKL